MAAISIDLPTPDGAKWILPILALDAFSNASWEQTDSYTGKAVARRPVTTATLLIQSFFFYVQCLVCINKKLFTSNQVHRY